MINQELLEEYKQRFIRHNIRDINDDVPELTTDEVGEHYDIDLDMLEVTADMLAKLLDGNPWWYLTLGRIINSRCTENTPFSEVNPIPKAEYCEILMQECFDSIVSELALHGREWVHPFESEEMPTTGWLSLTGNGLTPAPPPHSWQNQGF